MPSRPLRKHLLDRLLSGAKDVGERGLALLMTAGVVSCGAGTDTSGLSDASTKDQAADRGIAVEAANLEGGVVVEAANRDGSVLVEAAQVEGGTPDAGSDTGGSDAPCEARAVEAAFFDSGC
jgi:hypothetical protein